MRAPCPGDANVRVIEKARRFTDVGRKLPAYLRANKEIRSPQPPPPQPLRAFFNKAHFYKSLSRLHLHLTRPTGGGRSPCGNPRQKQSPKLWPNGIRPMFHVEHLRKSKESLGCMARWQFCSHTASFPTTRRHNGRNRARPLSQGAPHPPCCSVVSLPRDNGVELVPPLHSASTSQYEPMISAFAQRGQPHRLRAFAKSRI